MTATLAMRELLMFTGGPENTAAEYATTSLAVLATNLSSRSVLGEQFSSH